jgi:hypothetical protein
MTVRALDGAGVVIDDLLGAAELAMTRAAAIFVYRHFDLADGVWVRVGY